MIPEDVREAYKAAFRVSHEARFRFPCAASPADELLGSLEASHVADRSHGGERHDHVDPRIVIRRFTPSFANAERAKSRAMTLRSLPSRSNSRR
jgi:hypothetical protein